MTSSWCLFSSAKNSSSSSMGFFWIPIRKVSKLCTYSPRLAAPAIRAAPFMVCNCLSKLSRLPPGDPDSDQAKILWSISSSSSSVSSRNIGRISSAGSSVSTPVATSTGGSCSGALSTSGAIRTSGMASGVASGVASTSTGLKSIASSSAITPPAGLRA